MEGGKLPMDGMDNGVETTDGDDDDWWMLDWTHRIFPHPQSSSVVSFLVWGNFGRVPLFAVLHPLPIKRIFCLLYSDLNGLNFEIPMYLSCSSFPPNKYTYHIWEFSNNYNNFQNFFYLALHLLRILDMKMWVKFKIIHNNLEAECIY
jgi:hypothetical protein